MFLGEDSLAIKFALNDDLAVVGGSICIEPLMADCKNH